MWRTERSVGEKNWMKNPGCFRSIASVSRQIRERGKMSNIPVSEVFQIKDLVLLILPTCPYMHFYTFMTYGTHLFCSVNLMLIGKR